MEEQIVCKMFSKSKSALEKLLKDLELNYVVSASRKIAWSDVHDDWETWVSLISYSEVRKRE